MSYSRHDVGRRAGTTPFHVKQKQNAELVSPGWRRDDFSHSAAPAASAIASLDDEKSPSIKPSSEALEFL
jgi:hypothetical protein